MKTARAIPILLLLALVPALLAPEAGVGLPSARAAASQSGSLKGVVLDPNDARIAGAVIRMEGASFFRETESDEEGNFEIELPGGTYRLTVEKEGFKRFSLSPVQLSVGGHEVLKVHMKVMPPKSTVKIQAGR